MDFKSWKEKNNDAKINSNGEPNCPKTNGSVKPKSADNLYNNAKKNSGSFDNTINKSANNFGGDQSNINTNDKAKLQDTISKYMGKSENDLMSEFASTAAKMKAEGKLNKKEIDEFYNKIKGFLNEEQLEKLKSLIKMLEV